MSHIYKVLYNELDCKSEVVSIKITSPFYFEIKNGIANQRDFFEAEFKRQLNNLVKRNSELHHVTIIKVEYEGFQL